MPNWESPLQIDPIVKQWGTGGQATRPTDWPDDEPPVMQIPPPIEDPPPPPEVIEPEYMPQQWSLTRAIWYAIGVSTIALILLVAWVYVQLRHHMTAITAHPTTGGPHNGTVFAGLVVVVFVLIGIPAIARWLLGRN